MASGNEQLEKATAHHRAGRLREAQRIYREILEREPDHAEAMYLLGMMAFQERRIEAAIDWFRRAATADPRVAKYHGALGAAHATARRFDEALAPLEKAVSLEPSSADAHGNLATVLRELGRPEDAIAAFRTTAELAPDSAEAHGNLAGALYQAGRNDDALLSARAAVATAPADAEAQSNLGLIAMATGHDEEARTALHEAVRLKPDFAEAHGNLGVALQRQGRLAESKVHLRKLIALRPGDGGGYVNLAKTVRLQGDIGEAVALYRRAVELRPESPAYHSSLLMLLNGDPDTDERTLFEEHRRWNARHAAALTAGAPPHDNDRAPGRRLRIGYVSPDFRRHSVGYVVLPVIARHDHDAFEVFCYSAAPQADALTGQFRDHADHWRDIAAMSDEDAAAAIRDDRIDILVDLAGHTAGNRLMVMARRPAPVQASWAGYPNTTGLDAVDWLIGDAVQTPETAEALFAERIARMPHGLLCFEPPPDGPDVGALPASADGRITFGSLNNTSKVTPPVIALWAGVVAAVPGSRLMMKYRGLDDGDTQDRFREAFAVHGVAEQSLIFRGASARHAEVLDTYNGIDIALDPFPYSGAVTTLEALWMGVPVIALAGDRMAGRQSAGHLSHIGLNDLIAADADGYVSVARRLAGDTAALTALRRGLRGRVESAPLCDAAGFTRDLEALYRDMWRRWCEAGAG